MSSIKATLGAARIRHALERGDWARTPGDRRAARPVCRISYGDEINRELAPGVTLSGDVYDVRIDATLSTSDGVRLRVVFDGAARLDAAISLIAHSLAC